MTILVTSPKRLISYILRGLGHWIAWSFSYEKEVKNGNAKTAGQAAKGCRERHEEKGDKGSQVSRRRKVKTTNALSPALMKKIKDERNSYGKKVYSGRH